MRYTVTPALFVALSVSMLSAQATLSVPGQYATVQAAIDAAMPNDVVQVSPGTYFENIDFMGKDVVVESTQGAAATTIDGNGNGSVVTFASSEGPGAILRGLTITNGTGTATLCSPPPNPNTRGGGIICCASSPTIEQCVITGNSSTDDGGGVYARGAGASPTLDRCIITSNSSGNGGGIYACCGAGYDVVNCIIANNTASTAGGGGIALLGGSNVSIRSSTVTGNTAAQGAGILMNGPNVTIVNSIVWGNLSDQIWVAGTATPPQVSFSDVQGGWPGNGNIDANPLFVNPASGDYRLAGHSPCIDAGDSSVPNLPSVDFEGDPRIVGGTVDIGADEYMGVRVTASTDPILGLTVNLSSPTASAPLYVGLDTQLGAFQLGFYSYTQIALSSDLVMLAAWTPTLGPSVSPNTLTDANGNWSLSFPTNLLYYVYGLQGFSAHFEGFVLDFLAPNGLFWQSNLATLTFPPL